MAQVWPSGLGGCIPGSQARAQHTRMTLVCEKCGSQYVRAPSLCIVCRDERGSLGRDGQRWLTVDQLHEQHRNVLLEEEPEILSVGVEPAFGVGQRALLIQTGTTMTPYVDGCTQNRAQRCNIAKGVSDLHATLAPSPKHFSEARLLEI